MVIVKFISTKVMCIDDNEFVEWVVFHCMEDAKKYIKKEEDKIETYNKACGSIVLYRNGSGQLYTLEQFDKLRMHEIEDMEVGMLFRIKMICIG